MLSLAITLVDLYRVLVYAFETGSVRFLRNLVRRRRYAFSKRWRNSEVVMTAANECASFHGNPHAHVLISNRAYLCIQ